MALKNIDADDECRYRMAALDVLVEIATDKNANTGNLNETSLRLSAAMTILQYTIVPAILSEDCDWEELPDEG
jgi:hypothetical protein